MKKFVTFLFAILLICSCSVIASAEEGKYDTAGDLYEAWYETLPDYICGVWSTDGGASNLTFGIQNTELGNAGKTEMLELVKDDSSITFVYQEHSRNYLLQIQKELDGYFEKDFGLISTGLNEKNNCIVLGIFEERKDEADTQKMIGEITQKYGNAVSVEYTAASVEYTDELSVLTTDNNRPQYTQLSTLLIGVLGALALFGIGLVFFRRKHMEDRC